MIYYLLLNELLHAQQNAISMQSKKISTIRSGPLFLGQGDKIV